jgi:hypothetical protein
MAFGNQGHPVCRGAESVEFRESKGINSSQFFAPHSHTNSPFCELTSALTTNFRVRRPEELLLCVHLTSFPSPPPGWPQRSKRWVARLVSLILVQRR